MKSTALGLTALLVNILAVMPIQTQHGPMVLAQMIPASPRSYIEVGQPSYELTPLSNGRTQISWKLDILDKGSRSHKLEVRIRFFDDKHSQVLEDSISRVSVPAGLKVILTHTTVTTAKKANSIRSAEVSAKLAEKAARPTPAKKPADTTTQPTADTGSSGERP